MKKELKFVSDAVPLGVDKSCGLWYYTHVLAYRVTFRTNGTDYLIERYDRINAYWTTVLSGSSLDFTIKALLDYEPFLTPAETVVFWAGVHIHG